MIRMNSADIVIIVFISIMVLIAILALLFYFCFYNKGKCRLQNPNGNSPEAGLTNRDLIQSMLDENVQTKNIE